MKRSRSTGPVLATALLLLGMGVAAFAEDVEGVVRFEGKKPRRRTIQMREKRGKPSACQALHETALLDERLVVGEKGGLANVFVYVTKGLEKKKYDPPKEPAVLGQDKCMFRPRVLGFQVGQEFKMKNNDPVIHNIRSFSTVNRAFNIAQPPETPDRKKVFTAAEKAVKITCDIHPWMAGYFFVMEHPYFAVTDKKGQFKIKGLPAGDYTLTAWHEELGEREAKVIVGKDGSAKVKVTFTFKAKSKTDKK